MSKAGNPQRRNTYLISLTLVKVEPVSEDVAGHPEEALPEGEWSSKQEAEKEGRPEYTQEARKRSAAAEGGGEEEGEKPPVRHGSPVKSWQTPERLLDARGLQKDPTPAGKSKDAAFVQPPVRHLVKVYGRPTSEGAVRREGPRSESLRPKTEVYREPPVLFLKAENGAEASGRSRCSLPFPIPPQVAQRPDAPVRSHSGGSAVGWRELREASSLHPPAKTLDRRDNRTGDQSPLPAATTLGPYRASWADSDGRGTLIRPGPPASGGFSGVMTRDGPPGERFQTSASHPAPAQRKGPSRTLDNSELHSTAEEPRRGKEAQEGTIQRAPPRDRKMLKFISGIFTKSTAAPSASTAASASPAVGSEEEGKAFRQGAHSGPGAVGPSFPSAF